MSEWQFAEAQCKIEKQNQNKKKTQYIPENKWSS